MGLQPWKRLDSTILYTHPRLTLVEDDVLLPNGHRTKYLHFGTRLDAAMIIALNTDGELLVQREYHYALDDFLYQFPGGGLEDGESIESGALREFAEEAKLTGTLHPIGSFYLDARRSDTKLHTFVATDLHPREAAGDIEEELESVWLKPEAIAEQIRRGELTNPTLLAGWALFVNSSFYTRR